MTAFLSAQVFIKPNSAKLSLNLLDILFQWDSGWYIEIVEQGYSCDVTIESSCAFFPLFPLMIKLLSFIIQDIKVSGYLISILFSWIGTIYLYKLAILDFSSLQSEWIVLLFLFNPMTFFTSIIYTEGIFFFLVAVSFYYARKRNWLLVTIAGFLLCATRATGILIIIPVLIEYFRENESWNFNISKYLNSSFLLVLLIPFGLFLYMLYLQIFFDEFFGFIKTSSVWGRKLDFPWVMIKAIWNQNFFYQFLFGMSFLISFSLITIAIIKKYRLSYIVYSTISFLLIISTSHPASIPRYFSVVLPFYIFIISIIRENSFLFQILFSISSIFMTMYLILFANGYWMV